MSRPLASEATMKVDGRCHCGKITYEGMVDPARVTVCNCTDCQTLSGSAFRTSVPAPRETFSLQGAPTIYVKTAESGTKRVHAFCPDCGTPIYSSAIGDPLTYTLRVGGLAQRQDLPPKKQIWCRSAAVWAKDVPDLPKVEKQ